MRKETTVRDDVEIEAVADADIPQLVELWRECGLTVPHNDPHADIAFARGKTNSGVLVARLDGDVVASVMVGHDGHRGWLYYVAVSPAVQKTGLGTRIVEAGEDWLRARQVPKVMLMIRETNTEVRSFYEGIGYESAPRLVMQRKL